MLITAIGSMSAECAIKSYKNKNIYVVGCDIFPGEWHYETSLCDKFYQAPYATHKDEYITFLLNVCRDEKLSCIIPLTDLEIDVIREARSVFEEKGIVICTQSNEVLFFARNKYELYRRFRDDERVPSITTYLLCDLPDDFPFPCIAKPFDGRSSEGLLRNASKETIIAAIPHKENYIIQEQIEGSVFTVDYCRCANSGKDAVIPREELLRNKNGAGLTVRICLDETLIKLVSYIGTELGINGCINMEFILSSGRYYLIDINPRFSAGVAFSKMAGYDMTYNHIRCFFDETIDEAPILEKKIITKKYDEVFL